ncbi:hypothetical protein M9Y10_003196 [Tritrichomonas musculus]|uniref:Uncharacterized protein n=1 Tax=Tritrichomonas musculus TaxID=1915356 RepID=A0ABR2JPZ6_9EUKA
MDELQHSCNNDKAGCSNINYDFNNQISSFPSECQNRQIGQLMMQNQQLCNYNKVGCSNINYNFDNQISSFPSECQNPFFSPRIYSEVSHLKGTSHLTYAQIKSKLEYKYSLLKSVSRKI